MAEVIRRIGYTNVQATLRFYPSIVSAVRDVGAPGEQVATPEFEGRRVGHMPDCAAVRRRRLAFPQLVL